MSAFVVALLFAILPACPSEDSSWCHWDAADYGNGTGRSFVSLAPDTPPLFVN